MFIVDWSGSSEVKELHCGNKTVVIQCKLMGCSLWMYDPVPID